MDTRPSPRRFSERSLKYDLCLRSTLFTGESDKDEEVLVLRKLPGFSTKGTDFKVSFDLTSF